MMVSHYLAWIFTIVVVNHIAHANGDGTVNMTRLANTALSSQPLNLDTSPSLATKSDITSSATTRDISGRYGDINSRIIQITKSFYPQQSSCTVQISVVGKGIQDAFNGPCWAANTFTLNNDHLLIWGDPNRTPFTLYSDTPGTLVVIVNNRCTMKNYHNYNGRVIISATSMSDYNCKEVLNTIYQRMLAPSQIVAPQYTIDGVAATKGIERVVFSSRHWKSVVNGQCTKTIAVKGRGIADYMDVPCSAIRDPVMIMFGDWMLIGNPAKDDFSWFSEAWATTVVVNKGVCILRQYGVEHGYMKIAVSTISYDECHEAKKRMASKRIGLFDDLKELRENIKHKIGSLLPIRLG